MHCIRCAVLTYQVTICKVVLLKILMAKNKKRPQWQFACIPRFPPRRLHHTTPELCHPALAGTEEALGLVPA